MTNCTCRRAVRLGAVKISVNRKRGVSHWIEHMDGSNVCVPGDWTCAALKPYAKVENDRPSRQLVARWESAVSSDARLTDLVEGKACGSATNPSSLAAARSPGAVPARTLTTVSDPLAALRSQVDASHVTTTIWRLQRAATQSVSPDEPRSVMLEAARLLRWLVPVLTEGNQD